MINLITEHWVTITLVISFTTIFAVGIVKAGNIQDDWGNPSKYLEKPDSYNYESEHIKSEDLSAKKYVKD